LDGRHTVALRIAVFVLDRDDKLLAEDWKTMSLRLEEDTYRRFLESGIPFSVTLALAATRPVLKIVVYDLRGDKVGSRQVR
jgi:hypothetical protein